jgi:uncharacterized glyoxalase superfamily protein PhnB
MRRTESRDNLLARQASAEIGARAISFWPRRAFAKSIEKGAAMAIAKQTTATVIPALQYQDAPAAIAFLCKAFGFEKMAVYEGEGGTIEHAQLTLGNGMVMLGSAKDTDYGKLLVRPHAAGGVTMSVYCIVADPDAHFARAKAAGAEITREPVTQDYGGRDYTCKDPEGHVWTFGTYDPWAAY